MSKNLTLPKAPKKGSVQYVAFEFDVSVPVVYDLIRDGKLVAYKIGRLTRVSDKAIADCKALLESTPFKPFDRKKRSAEIAEAAMLSMRPRVTA